MVECDHGKRLSACGEVSADRHLDLIRHRACPSRCAAAAVVVEQGVDHRLQVAGQDVVELVERQVDAVIGQPVVGKVVGADALAAVAGADQRSPFVGPRCVLLLPLQFVEPRFQHAQGLGEILVLAFFILALHDQARFVMRQPDGGGRFVDVLAAGAAGAENVLAIIVRLDVDFDVFGLGQHGDGGGGGVDAALGFGLRERAARDGRRFRIADRR